LDEACAFEEKSYAVAKTGTWHLQNVLALVGRVCEPESTRLAEILTLLAAPLTDAPER
jgi:hypothetical protein